MLTVNHQAMNEALGENSMMNEVFTKYCKKRYKALSHVLRSKTKVEAPSLSQPKTLRKRSTTLYSKGELLNSKAILWVDGKLSDHLSTFDTLEMKHRGKPGDDSEVLYDTVRILRFENGKRIFSEEKTSIFHENYIINPSGTYRMAWDAFVGSLVFYTSLIVPVEIAFAGDAFDQTGAIGYLIDGFFFIDIILNFRTAIRSSVDENAIIIAPQAIAERYLRSWFVVDFISAIPFDAILSRIVGENSASFGSLLKIFRAVRLLRLMRIFKFQFYVQQLEAMFGIPPAIFNLLRLLVEVYMFVHWVSCLWWGITSVMTHHPWYTKSGPDGFFWGSLVGPDAKISAKYLVSTYFTFASITTTGYGDIHPIHPLERLLCIFLVLAGASIFTYMIARLSQILSTLSSHSFSSGEKIATIREFLKERQAPKSLRGRIVDHFTRQFKDSSSYDITTIVDRLPQYLGNKILFNIYEKFILKISFFKYIKKQSVQLYLFRLLRPVYYEANHYLFKEGEEAVELIFIISGTVRMFRKLKQPEVKPVKAVEEDWFVERKRDEQESEKNSFENDNNTESDSNNNSLKNNHHLSIDPTLAERTDRRGPTSARTTPGSKYFSLSLGSRFFASNPVTDGATTTSQSAAALPKTSGSGGSLRLRGILAGSKKKAVSFSNFRTTGPATDPLTKTQHLYNSSVKASSANNNDSGPRESTLTSQKTRRKVKSGRRFSLKRQGSTQSDDDIHEHQTLYANLAELRTSTRDAYDHLDRFDRPFNQLEFEDFRLLNFELIGDLTVGDFLGHNAHMINEGKHVTSARTIDHATVYTLSHYEISKLVRVEPSVGIQLQNALTQAIIAQTDSVGRYLHRRRRGDFLKQVKQDYDRAKSRGGVQLPKLNSENLRAREFPAPPAAGGEEEEKADDVEEAGELHQHYSADQLDDFRLPVDTLPPPAKENSLRKKLHRQLSARLTQIKLPQSAPTTPAQRERKKISFAAEAPDGPQLAAPPAENITVTRKFQTDSHLLVARKKRPSLSGEQKSGGADGDDFGHFHLSNAKQAARVRALDEMFHKRRIYYDSDADSESEQPQRTRTKRFEMLRDRSKILRRTNSSESLVGPDDKPLPAAAPAVSPATVPPSSLRSRLAKFFSRKKTVRRGSGELYALASTRPRTDSAEALELTELHGATPIGEEEKEAQSRKKQKGDRRPRLKHFSSTNRDEFHAKVRRRSYSLNDLTEKELLFRRSLEKLFRSSAPPSSALPTSPMSPTSPTFLSPSGSNYGQLLGHQPFSLDLQDEDLGSKKVQASDSVKEIEFGLNNNYIERRSRRRVEPGETEAGAGAGVVGKNAAIGREEATAEEFNPLIHKKRRQSFPSYDFPEWKDDRLHRFIL
jgi:CRP-like cAMP-binding protein